MKHLLSFLLLSSLAVLLVCCSDNGVTTNNNNPTADPSIWQTDSLGNNLGGDSTNWCLSGSNGECTYLKPAYPNPVYKYFNVKYLSTASINLPDTVSIFFINTPDTNFVIKNKLVSAGTYNIRLDKDSLGYSKEIKTLYIVRRNINGCNALMGRCSKLGRVQFY